MSAVEESVNRQLVELSRPALSEGERTAFAREIQLLRGCSDRIRARGLPQGEVLATGAGPGRQRPSATRGALAA